MYNILKLSPLYKSTVTQKLIVASMMSLDGFFEDPDK
jgi:hypothetical protein